jgi:hypothetical protein
MFLFYHIQHPLPTHSYIHTHTLTHPLTHSSAHTLTHTLYHSTYPHSTHSTLTHTFAHTHTYTITHTHSTLPQVPIPIGIHDVYEEAEFVSGLSKLIVRNPAVNQWVFKLDDQSGMCV